MTTSTDFARPVARRLAAGRTVDVHVRRLEPEPARPRSRVGPAPPGQYIGRYSGVGSQTRRGVLYYQRPVPIHSSYSWSAGGDVTPNGRVPP